MSKKYMGNKTIEKRPILQLKYFKNNNILIVGQKWFCILGAAILFFAECMQNNLNLQKSP